MPYGAAIFALLPVLAQTFDVASVKPSPPDNGVYYNANLGTIQHGQVTLANATLADCLKFAMSLAGDEQIAGPDWVKSKAVRFDIDAKASPNTPPERIRGMLMALLNERFQLRTHTEQRRLSHYVLSVAKTGSKMEEVPTPVTRPFSRNLIGHLTHEGSQMKTLVLLLSRFLHELVIDETGLAGYYKFDLQWAPDPPAQLNGNPVEGPTIFSAVRDQLGLRLENSKAPVDVLVVDSAVQTPLAN